MYILFIFLQIVLLTCTLIIAAALKNIQNVMITFLEEYLKNK